MRLAAAVAMLVMATTLEAQSLGARLDAAIARYDRGERDAARRDMESLIATFNARGGAASSADLTAVATAITYLGVDDPQLFKDAMRAYDRAIAADPANMEARVRLAELFLEKYNSGEARKTITEALAKNPNHVPTLILDARRRDFDHERGADSVLGRALNLDPENVAGRVLRARFRSDVEDFRSAKLEVDRALRKAPDDPDALAFGAALAHVTGDSATARMHRQKFTSLYPRDARLQNATSELLARVRQYGLAAEAARQGTRVDPRSWRAHANLGTNLLRLGQIAEGRKSLETAFEGDPYDVWTKNTLDLLDTFDEYDEVTHGRFRFMIDTAESAIMRLYLAELADRAYETFSKRYGYTPSTPVRMEVYRSHADFSVRTVGLAGLGALGVSFGNTVAFDSPAARDAGPFNWASTAWHELAHTFTLGATSQRIPRWLSEGLSVFEERRGRSGWGQNVSLGFLRAYADGRLTPVSRLNDGFVRPAYPGQVQHSYFMASLVCELIVKDHGEKALTDMLRGYRNGLSTEQVFQTVLRTDLATFDKRFDQFMRERYGHAIPAAKDGSYARLVAQGEQQLKGGNAAAAITTLERARAIFPELGGGESAYPHLVRAYVARGDRRKAAEVLTAMNALGDVPYEMHVQLADMLVAQGDTARAAEALESALFMNPYDITQHQRLAAWFAASGDRKRAVRERLAVVALRPVDRADAWYQLALAQRTAGEVSDARRSVLRALEEAPHFEKAQELLLALRAGTR